MARNITPLDAELAKAIKSLFRKSAEAVLECADACRDLCDQYSDRRGRYKAELVKFISSKLGWSKSKFSNLVQISRSDVIQNLRKKDPDAVPSSWTVLYTIHNWHPALFDSAVKGTHKFDAGTKKWEKREGKPKPVIHQDATRSQIAAFHKQAKHPKAIEVEPRTLHLASIYIHNGLMDFDASGKPNGAMNVTDMDKLAAELISMESATIRVVLNNEKLKARAAKESGIVRPKARADALVAHAVLPGFEPPTKRSVKFQNDMRRKPKSRKQEKHLSKLAARRIERNDEKASERDPNLAYARAFDVQMKRLDKQQHKELLREASRLGKSPAQLLEDESNKAVNEFAARRNKAKPKRDFSKIKV